MGLSVIIGGATPETHTGLNPAVQNNRWLITFPYTNDTVSVSSPLIADCDWQLSPVSVFSENKVGTEVPGFAGDWYNRIHVTPININAGNLLTEQTYDVTVWNAFFEPKTLLSISESADSGMQLIQPEATPVAFSALEALVYQLKVGTNGPPLVSGSYLFDFGFTTITMTAAGQRVVVWPFVPQHGVDEVIEWKTDVIRAKAREQRVALRDAPRQSFSYNFFMDDKQVSRARAMSYGWAHRQFGMPVWTEATFIGPMSSGATTIPVDTTVADYRVDDILVIWESDEKFEAIGIESITPGDVTLKAGTNINFMAAYVCPMRYARALKGLTLSRGPNELIKGEVDFQVEVNIDRGQSAGLPVHGGIDVLTDIMYYLGNHSESIVREVEIIDNGFGNIYPDAIYTESKQSFTISFSLVNRSQLTRIRKWLHLVKGKLKPFWLPSRSRDLELAIDASSSAQSVDVYTINYPLYYTTRTLQIVRKNGVRTYHNVIGGTSNGVTDTLSFDSAIGVTTNVSDVDYISFMYKVRLDADRVEIKHEENGYATIKIPAVEVSA